MQHLYSVAVHVNIGFHGSNGNISDTFGVVLRYFPPERNLYC